MTKRLLFLVAVLAAALSAQPINTAPSCQQTVVGSAAVPTPCACPSAPGTMPLAQLGTQCYRASTATAYVCYGTVTGNRCAVPGDWAAATGAGGGTVTSVACNSSFAVSWLTCSFGGSGSVTPVLQLTPTSALTQNQVLATPNGSAGAVGLRALVAADIPALSYGNVSNSGTPLIHQGAIFTDATHIKGLSTYTIDDSGNLLATSAALGGATIGSDALGVTGTTTHNGAVTFNASPIIISGNISAAAWATNGLRIKGVPGTLTDTSTAESGTVATGYTDVLGGNSIAATNTGVTYTNYISEYVKAPVAGTHVTITNPYAIGADSLIVGTSNAFTVSAAGAVNALSTVTAAGEIVTGTAATDTATLGSEVTTSGTCSGTGWTGTYPNYVAPATTAALTCTGFTNNAYYQTVTGITNNAGVTGMTYGSGLSCTGTGTYPLTVTGGGGSGATGTITVTSGAVTAAIAVLTAGTAFTSTPTTGTLGTPTGSASCSGTLAMTSTIGGGTITVAIGSAGAAQQSGTSTNAASSTFIWGPKANGTSLTYTPTAAFVGTINISAKAITPISTFALTLKDSTGAASSVCTQTLASLFNLFCGGGGTYTTTGNSNTASCYGALFSNTTGASNTASGYLALYFNTAGSYNTASGYGALYNCGTSGATCASNVALGFYAGRYAGTGTTALTNISTSILIGYGAAAANATGDSNEILICGTGSVAANGTNTAALGCPATTDVYAGSAGAALTHTAGIANGGTVYSVAGTPLPTCNSTNLLKRLPASDITTLGAAYVGSGTFTAWVECTYNSTGAVYAWYAM